MTWKRAMKYVIGVMMVICGYLFVPTEIYAVGTTVSVGLPTDPIVINQSVSFTIQSDPNRDLVYQIRQTSPVKKLVKVGTITRVQNKGVNKLTIKFTTSGQYTVQANYSGLSFVSRSFEVLSALPKKAVIEAYVSLFMAEGTTLNRSIRSGMKQSLINQTFSDLTVTFKTVSGQSIASLGGASIWKAADSSGSLGAYDGVQFIKGHLLITDVPSDVTSVEISGGGYLMKTISNVTMVENTIQALGSSSSAPIELLPGDIGGEEDGKLIRQADHQINNLDFSVWLSIFKEAFPTEVQKRKADFTKDGEINNLDFSLWLNASKRAG